MFRSLKRDGLVQATPIPKRSSRSVWAALEADSSEGAVIYADGWTACASLRPQGDHVMMRKDKGWSMGQDQINGIEGSWRDAKSWLAPSNGEPQKFLPLFLGEICHRCDHRYQDMNPLLMDRM